MKILIKEAPVSECVDYEVFELATQSECVFSALEAQENAEALREILQYGRIMQMLWDAGLSTPEIRSSLEVN